MMVATNQRWIPKEGGSSWRVVSMEPEGLVALTGPGPCRAMKYISVDDLEKEFVLDQTVKTVDIQRMEREVRKNIVITRR